MDVMKMLVMIKPDAISRGLIEPLLEEINSIDFATSLGTISGTYTKEDLEFLYSHLINEPFWPRIHDGMIGKPYIAIRFYGFYLDSTFTESDFIKTVRNKVECIRAKWHNDGPKHENLVHASSSVEDARREIEYFFLKPKVN